MKFKFFIFSLLLFGMFLSFQQTAMADSSATMSRAGDSKTSLFMQKAGLGTSARISTIAASLIETILGFLGIIFVVLIIISGFQWMTAQGNEEKIEKAKKNITNAVIGLLIIVAAYSITYFVFNLINDSSTGTNVLE
jgi:hypothetical protein